MRIFRFLLFGLLLASPVIAENVVLVNGSVIDGTGKPRVVANIRIREGKISDIGPVKPAAGETVVDVKGMLVTPGFIDIETLSPSAIERDPAATALITQGV